MNAQFLTFLTENQQQAIKDIINLGFWGDCQMNFGGNCHANYAYGYITNLKNKGTFKGKYFSGLLSGISKAITKNKSDEILMISDWWQDGSGNVIFFNLDKIDKEELEKWATPPLVQPKADYRNNTSFSIGYGRLISDNLIGTMVDLQSTVITTLTGEPIAWIHEHKEVIVSCAGSGKYVTELTAKSILSDKIKEYQIIEDSKRNWGIKTTFIYPDVFPVS